MNHPILISAAILLAASAWAQTQPFPPAAFSNAPAGPKTISAKEMLITGPSPLKLHALSMIAQKGDLDESYLPGLKVCSEDPVLPVRIFAAQLLGQHFVEGKDDPNPEAVALLLQLAGDESTHVRYNAVYYGLAPLKEKSPEVIELLIEAAASDRDQLLNERITQSLASYRDETVQILDKKLQEDDPIAYFEIYEQLAGKEPATTERLLDMPSSFPVMFVFNGKGDDSDTFKADLESELKTLGLTNPQLSDASTGDNFTVMLKTYMTRDRITVEKAFADHATFPMPQIWYLTPELEAQFDGMRNK